MRARTILASAAALALSAGAAIANPYPTPVFGNYAQRVDNLSALKLLAINSAVIARGAHRDGYSAAGDGGAADYTYSPLPCSLNSGAGDDGSQILASDSKCWLLAAKPYGETVKVFGAVCDAQVLYDWMLVTAGSGGTRQVTLGGTPAKLPTAGQLIDVAIGGASAGAAWQGTVVSVSGTTTPVITVTAGAGTAIGSATSGVVQWGTNDNTPIHNTVAALQGVANILIPGQCLITSRLTLSAPRAAMFGTLPPPVHHDGVEPWSPPLSSALVWGGGYDVMLLQTSVDGASNLVSKGQRIRDLAFFGGNSAGSGRQIATVTNSEAERLYATDATLYNFAYGINGVTNIGEIAATCYLNERDLVSDSVRYGAVGFLFSGDVPHARNVCLSSFMNLMAVFSAADAIQVAFADHNYFENITMIGNGAATTAYSLHFTSLDASNYAQGNHFYKVSVGNISNNTQGRVRVEAQALGNSITRLDTFNPPAGWLPSNASPRFECTTDDGADCATIPIAQLPTCAAGLIGKSVRINNGIAAPTYHQAVSTTGTASWPVSCTYNGTTYGWAY